MSTVPYKSWLQLDIINILSSQSMAYLEFVEWMSRNGFLTNKNHKIKVQSEKLMGRRRAASIIVIDKECDIGGPSSNSGLAFTFAQTSL